MSRSIEEIQINPAKCETNKKSLSKNIPDIISNKFTKYMFSGPMDGLTVSFCRPSQLQRIRNSWGMPWGFFWRNVVLISSMASRRIVTVGLARRDGSNKCHGLQMPLTSNSPGPKSFNFSFKKGIVMTCSDWASAHIAPSFWEPCRMSIFFA